MFWAQVEATFAESWSDRLKPKFLGEVRATCASFDTRRLRQRSQKAVRILLRVSWARLEQRLQVVTRKALAGSMGVDAGVGLQGSVGAACRANSSHQNGASGLRLWRSWVVGLRIFESSPSLPWRLLRESLAQSMFSNVLVVYSERG